VATEQRSKAPLRSGSTELGSRRRWPGVIIGLIAVAVKGVLYARFLDHNVHWAVWLLAFVAAISLLHARPLRTVLYLAPFIALVVDPPQLLVGVALAVGSFVAMVGICLLIGTVLNWIEDRSGT
jgi:hypothetical protein